MARGSTVKKRLKSGQYQWYAIYDVGSQFDPVSLKYKRKQKWEKAIPNTKKRAEKILAERILDSARTSGPQPITFRRMCEKYFDYIEPLVTETTLVRHKSIYKNHFQELGDLQLAALDKELIAQFFSEMSKTLKPNYVKSATALLKTILNQAVEWNYIETVKWPKFPKQKTQKIINPLNVEESKRLLQVTEAVQPHDVALIQMAIECGLRNSELRGAQWQFIDWDKKTYHVAYQGHNNLQKLVPVKTPNSNANVCLTDSMMRTLERHRTYTARHLLKSGLSNTLDLLFPSRQTGGITNIRTPNQILSRLLAHANIESRRFHDLRHTCATLLLKGHQSVKFAQAQMRHASADLTLDTYGHLLEEDIQDAMAYMNDLLSNP